MKKILLLFLLLFGFVINAQTISGKIMSFEEKQPVPFAKIAFENEDQGVVADENGNFVLNISDSDKLKTLKVEVGGFEKYFVPLAKFLNENTHNIYLKEKVRTIAEVKIDPAKYVSKNWGVNTKTTKVLIGHNPSKEKDDRSKEIAMLFKTNKKVKIEKINLNVVQFKSDKPVFIRFSIYDKDLNSLLNEDLIDEITAEKIVDGTYSFNVSKKGLWMNGDFYVGIQILSNFEGYFFMSGALFGNKTIYRKYAGPWEKVPFVSPAINIDVKIKK